MMQARCKRHPFHSAIIVAGGSGSRMGTDKTKQMIQLLGLPVIIRTLKAFEACGCIDEIILVARANEVSQYPELLRKYNISKVRRVVPGGDTRQASVIEGLRAISDKTAYLSIHDGARCLITPEQIEAVAKTAYQYRAAAAASRAKDTVKMADGRDCVAKTLDREQIWLAGTPQTFLVELYRACAYTAKEKGITATDDSMLCEAFGYRVHLVDVGYENIKITTPEDLLFAKAILGKREGGGIQ